MSLHVTPVGFEFTTFRSAARIPLRKSDKKDIKFTAVFGRRPVRLFAPAFPLQRRMRPDTCSFRSPGRSASPLCSHSNTCITPTIVMMP